MTDRMANTIMVTKSTPTDTSQNTTSNKEVNACDNANDMAVVGAYLKCNFILPKERTTYSPYSLGLFLTRHHDTIIDGVKISRSKIIDYLMSMGLIPVKKTTAYKVEGFVTMGVLPQFSTWTDLAKNGRKAILTNREITILVDQIKMATKGGEGMGSKCIKKRLKEYIYQVYSHRGQLHKLPRDISEHTINSIVSTVKSQCIFNLYDTVANKTESRRAAEWSLRSTLAYSTIVACIHFIPLDSPSKYHVKKSDLNPEATKLWHLAETCYNSMIGDVSLKKNLYPILPNLLTTTDEVTIFATAGNIQKNESFYLVAKPEEIKNEACHSGARNCYTTKQVGDSHFRGVRIVINSTFTAGGLSAPIFIAVYGLSAEEMPNDEMICIKVPGLVSGSHQNVYSGGNGFITFVRGAVDVPVHSPNVQSTSNSIPSDESRAFSKESKVAQLYRQKVYYPFVKKIRKDKYNFDGHEEDIPEGLRAVSWMDGCAS